MNGDWRATEAISLGEGKPATNITVHHDDKGRTPVQIYAEDVLKRRDVDIRELAAKDSKELDEADKLNLIHDILTASERGYGRVLVVMGTDKAVEIGRCIGCACRPRPAVPVVIATAMTEMTRDMDLETNAFVSFNTDGIAAFDDALSADLPAGVHIMTENAGYADPMVVEKDFEGLRFLAKPSLLT